MTEQNPLRDEFDRYVRERRRPWLAYAVGLCHDLSLAEDLVQETSLKLWEVWPVKRELILSRPGYEFTTLRNTYYSHCRKVKSEARAVDEVQQQANTAPLVDPTEAQGVRDQIRGVLRNLPARHQEVYFLRQYGGYSATEVGKILGLTPRTVDTYHSSARKKIEELLRGATK